MKKIWTREKVIERIKELHKQLGHRPTKYEVASLYNTARNLFGTWGNALRESGYSVKYFQTIKIPNILTNDLAYFVGIILSDGHIAYERGIKYAVKLYTSYKNEKCVLLQLIKDLFNYNPTIRIRKYGFNKLPNYEIIISSKILAEFLKDKFQIPAGKKSDKIRIPTIFFTDTKLFYDLLRGVIDGDGGISKVGVNIYSSSEAFLEDIKEILIRLKTRTYNIRKSTGHVYELTIPSKESVRLGKMVYKNARYFYPRVKNKWEESILNI